MQRTHVPHYLWLVLRCCDYLHRMLMPKAKAIAPQSAKNVSPTPSQTKVI